MSKFGIVDADFLLYRSACSSEKRSILVTNEELGFKKKFKNRTEFWGRGNQVGEYLAKLNKKHNKKLAREDFIVTDVYTAESIGKAYSVFDNALKQILYESKATGCKLFVGKGDSFRVERSTLMKYKGNRDGMRKPVHIDSVFEYAVDKYKAEIVTDIEADDRVIYECFKQNNKMVVGIDKDALGCPVFVYDVNSPSDGVIDCRGFGELFWDNKRNKVRGRGRQHLYFQLGIGDSVDNYIPSCFSDLKIGQKTVFNALKDCKSDKESLQTIVDLYKQMYPEPKIITGWRGNEIEIDWLYVLDEIFDMARMLRFDGDVVKVKDVLDNMGVDY